MNTTLYACEGRHRTSICRNVKWLNSSPTQFTFCIIYSYTSTAYLDIHKAIFELDQYTKQYLSMNLCCSYLSPEPSMGATSLSVVAFYIWSPCVFPSLSFPIHNDNTINGSAMGLQCSALVNAFELKTRDTSSDPNNQPIIPKCDMNYYYNPIALHIHLNI